MIIVGLSYRISPKFYHSSDWRSETIASIKKSSTFAHELIRELFWNSPNLLVISFSVINYVVSMRRPRESGEVSFFLYIILRTLYKCNNKKSRRTNWTPGFFYLGISIWDYLLYSSRPDWRNDTKPSIDRSYPRTGTNISPSGERRM